MEKYTDRNHGAPRQAKPRVIQGGYRAAFGDSDEKIAELARGEESDGKNRIQRGEAESRGERHRDKERGLKSESREIDESLDSSSGERSNRSKKTTKKKSKKRQENHENTEYLNRNRSESAGVTKVARKTDSLGCLPVMLIILGVVAVIILAALFFPGIDLSDVGPFKFSSSGEFRIEWPFGSGNGTNLENESEEGEKDVAGGTEEDLTVNSKITESVTFSDESTETKSDPLVFDARSADDYRNMLSKHNDFILAVDAFESDEIDEASFINVCEDTSRYFHDISVVLNYGYDEAQSNYLLLFQAAAMSDQIAADSVLKYLRDGTISELENDTSDANRNIGDADSAYKVIPERRESYLRGTGLSASEIESLGELMENEE